MIPSPIDENAPVVAENPPFALSPTVDSPPPITPVVAENPPLIAPPVVCEFDKTVTEIACFSMFWHSETKLKPYISRYILILGLSA